MKTVLSLHRKWAHAVKTIRILQGLVSVIVDGRFVGVAQPGSWSRPVRGRDVGVAVVLKASCVLQELVYSRFFFRIADKVASTVVK